MAQQYIEILKGLIERKLVVSARIVDERWLLSPKRIGNPTTQLGDVESRNVRKKRPSRAFSFTDEPGPSEFNFD